MGAILVSAWCVLRSLQGMCHSRLLPVRTRQFQPDNWSCGLWVWHFATEILHSNEREMHIGERVYQNAPAVSRTEVVTLLTKARGIIERLTDEQFECYSLPKVCLDRRCVIGLH